MTCNRQETTYQSLYAPLSWKRGKRVLARRWIIRGKAVFERYAETRHMLSHHTLTSEVSRLRTDRDETIACAFDNHFTSLSILPLREPLRQ